MTTPVRPTPHGFEALLRPELAELSAYSPPLSRCDVRLDANEAPDLLGDEARSRIHEVLRETALARYPDARAADLREAIAESTGAHPDEILVGAGSDDVIALLLTALSRPRPKAPMSTVLTVTPTFSMYRQSARARGQRVVEVPLDDAWDVAVDNVRTGIEMARPNLLFLASPNNPTGKLAPNDRLEAIIDAAGDAVVVVDEAYVQYASRDQLHLRGRPNVAILRTLSKVGFAALRVGWLIAPRPLIAELDKVRQPYNVPSASQAVAAVVLRELGGEVRALCEHVVAERTWLAGELESLGYECTPSDANFLWVKTPQPAEAVTRHLEGHGVLVRSFHRHGGRLRDRVRVTIGTRAEHERLLAALRVGP